MNNSNGEASVSVCLKNKNFSMSFIFSLCVGVFVMKSTNMVSSRDHKVFTYLTVELSLSLSLSLSPFFSPNLSLKRQVSLMYSARASLVKTFFLLLSLLLSL